ncbi:hypothetical protein HDV57DRAFT_484293 [Trichoderma longibrachiatum]
MRWISSRREPASANASVTIRGDERYIWSLGMSVMVSGSGARCMRHWTALPGYAYGTVTFPSFFVLSLSVRHLPVGAFHKYPSKVWTYVQSSCIEVQEGAMHDVPLPAPEKSPAAVAPNALAIWNLQVLSVRRVGYRLRSFHLDSLPRESIVSCRILDFGKRTKNAHTRQGHFKHIPTT